MNGARSANTGTSDATLNAGKPAPLVLRPKDAAKALGISERALWAAANSGRIPVVRFGRSTRYDVRDLIAYIDAHKSKGGNS